ncbi:head-tail adaptor protein [Kitasatospora sp. NPDC059646]|uniref:phage head completion protein n=1 Tax=Kitasatospora sp. NPDC059646 TaxID=3346893 RepID=UPI0036C5D0B1
MAVDVLRAGVPTRDRYGNDVPGVETVTSVDGCRVLPPGGQMAASTEVIAGRNLVTVSVVLFAPATADIRATDRVRYAGETYEVVGEPARYPGRLAHLEVQLKRWEG